jgi:type IV secretory pathway VirD2 relaxase
MVPGFEDVWRAASGGRRRPETVLGKLVDPPADVRARLARTARKAPEVMVKITGRTRDLGQLRAHLEYISRNGKLDLEGADGARLTGREAVRDLADDWALAALIDARTRANSPLSLSLILSMAAGTDALKVRGAVGAFAAEVFGGTFDYVFALHADEPHPHVHLTVACRGHEGQRLNPKKTDLESWRQVFAQALRDRGVEAEATPRRARGVIRKAERGTIRRLRERREQGGPVGRVQRAATQSAAQRAFGAPAAAGAWEGAIERRQQRVRTLYLAQARMLRTTGEAGDETLARAVEAFVSAMPVVETREQALMRELRTAAEHESRGRGPPSPERTR